MNVVLFFAIASVLFLVYATDSRSATKTKFCGTLSLAHKLTHKELVWKHRSKTSSGSNGGDFRYKSDCRFIAARYNCDRFKTSAADYELVLDESKHHSSCKLPDMSDLLLLLTNHRPTNILMIGDSHA
jgi:hypothetical protein